MNLPLDDKGRPMVIIAASASNLVQTVPFSNVTIGPVTITRAVIDDGDESIINATREIQRMVEYAVGVERRLLDWALDPAQMPVHPTTGEKFAAPPPGYDPASMPPHPAAAKA
jgi:hypothetical protein